MRINVSNSAARQGNSGEPSCCPAAPAEEIQQLTCRLSHDLREPLRMVTSFLDLLQSRYQARLDDEATEYIHFAVDGARRAESMLDGLLEYTRVESDGRDPVVIAGERTLRDIVSDLQTTRDQPDARVRIAELPTIRVDAAQWHQLWRHLLDNAFKFRAPDRPLVIEISAEDAGDCWRFNCCDNGIGVEPDQNERIFQVFQRLHPVGQYDGTGMGLPVCRRIIERHGGHIVCDPGPRQGTLIWFTLPKTA